MDVRLTILFNIISQHFPKLRYKANARKHSIISAKLSKISVTLFISEELVYRC